MLPSNIKALLDEVVSHKRREHERERNATLREFEFEMVRKGLGQSSQFVQGRTDIYCDAFEKFAVNVWKEMQRVLDGGFEYYSDGEHHLINFLKDSLTVACEADKNGLSNKLGPHIMVSSPLKPTPSDGNRLNCR